MTKRATELLLEQAKEALKGVEAERDAVSATHREREREERAEYQAEIVRLKRVIRELSKPRRTAAVQAGPKAVGKVRSVLRGGKTTQLEIARQTGLNDGTVSYALRALVEAGEIEPTGEREGGSRVFRSLPSRRRRSAA